MFDGKICRVLSKSVSNSSKVRYLAKWLHLCTWSELRHLNGTTAVKTIEMVWLLSLSFEFCSPLCLHCPVCHSYKQFLIATDREGSPICKECKQREQHGVINKTSLPGLTNGKAVWLLQLLLPYYFTSSFSNGLVHAKQMSAPSLARVQFLPFYWNDHAHYLI